MQKININTSISMFTRLLGIYYVLLILGAVNIGSIGSALKLFGFLPVIYWLLDKHSIRFNRLYTFVLLSCIWTFVSVVWSISSNDSFAHGISMLSFCLLLISSSSYSYNQNEITWLYRMLIWSSRITVIVTLAFSQLYQGRLYLHGVINEDPNYLCAYFLFGVVNCISVFFSLEKKRIKFASAIELMIYLLTVLSTGSRGGAIAIVAATIIAILANQRKQKLGINKIFQRMIFVVIVLMVFYLATCYVSADILNRYSISAVLESQGTGRFDIWVDTLKTFANSSLLRQIGGYGAATSLAIAKIMHFSMVNVTHNAFLEHLIELGVVGLLFYTIYIFRFLCYSFRSKNIFCTSVMIGFIAMSISTSIGAFKPYWNIMIFICCVSNQIVSTNRSMHEWK